MDSYVGHTARTEMDLIAFGSLVWRYRLAVAIACVLGVLGGIAYLMIATPMFKGEVVIIAAPEDSMSSGGGSSGVGDKLGGLASLAGLNMGQESPSELTADAVLDSRGLVEEFVRRNNLVDLVLQKAKRKTLWRAVNVFKLNLSKIKKDQLKGTTKVSVEWTDPRTAAAWANGLVALANETMRTRARIDASRNIDYLNHQLEGTNDVEVRKNLYDIIENETRTLMLANGRTEYSFRVVDAAVPSEVRSHPQPVLVLLIALGLGLAFGCTFAFVRERVAERRRETAETAARLQEWHDRRLANEGAASVVAKS